jgi:hypothetical protein
MLELTEPPNVDSKSQSKAAPAGSSQLYLPEVEFREKHRIGRRFCLLAPARTAAVGEIATMSVSARSSVELYHLNGGERIVVVDKTLPSIPDGVTAVLVRRTDGTSRWQWHQTLADFEDKMRSNASAVAADIEALELQPGGKSPRTFQCLDCDRPDPLKSDALRWLSGELGRDE